MTRLLIVCATALVGTQLYAVDPPAAPAAPAPATTAAAKEAPSANAPTEADVPYGKHPKQVLDFYRAKSDKPTPLVFFIHGGGWTAGSKAKPSVDGFLRAGISVVSVEYRFIQDAIEAGQNPPVDWPLKDAARALQFVRSKAKEWNIDKTRIGATGGSAGACSSLWLAFHDDMADPKSADPIARESTRLLCAAVSGAQTSLDPKELVVWTPNSRYGGHAFGYMDPKDVKSRDQRFAEFATHRDELLPLIKLYSPIELLTADDPPIYITYGAAPNMGQAEKDPTHTANYGVPLQAKAKSLGVECEFAYPGAPDVKHATMAAFLIDKLSGK